MCTHTCMRACVVCVDFFVHVTVLCMAGDKGGLGGA